MRIRNRLLMVTAGFLLAVAAVFSGLVYYLQTRSFEAGLDRELRTAAILAAELLPAGYHDGITNQNSVSPGTYQGIVRRNNRLCAQTGMEYLWTVMLLDGKVVFTSATSPGKDEKRQDHAKFLQAHSNPELYLETLRTQQPHFQVNDDRWGRIRVALVPFRDAQGRPWLAGASRSMNEVEALARQTAARSLWTGGIALALGALACLLAARSLARPIEEVTRAAAEMAAGRLEQVVQPRGGLELELLAQSMNRLSTAVQGRVSELAASREDLRITLQSIGDGVIATDAQGRVTRMNAVAEALTGWTAEQARGRPLREVFDIVNAHTRQPVEDPVARVLREGRVVGLANHTVLRTAGGKEYQIADSAAPILSREQAVMGVVLVFRDVTDDYAKDQALAESQARFRSLFDTMTEGVAVHELVCDAQGAPLDYRLIDVNPAYEGHTGIAPATARGRLASELYGSGAPPYLGLYARVAQTGAPEAFETCFDPLGKHFRVSVCSPKRGLFATIFTDVTREKTGQEALVKSEQALRESQERFETFMSRLPAAAFIKDRAGRLVYANKFLKDLFGWHGGEGKLTEELIPEPLAGPMRADDLQALAEGGLVVEERMPDGQGGERVFQTRKFPILAGGRPVYLGGIAVDITERVRHAESLKASLEEKEVLLREVHHRVKNNLQIVMSLLSLQSQQVRTPEVLDSIRQAQHRIRTMAVLHESLYRSENLARADFAAYLEKLCRQLFSAHGPAAASIQLELRLQPMTLDMDQAVSCGLIVNELVTNALKHAFTPGRPGRVTVELGAQGRRVWIGVEDDGGGLPDSVTPGRTGTLGLRLVYNLTQQLDGKLDVRRQGGASFRIEFTAAEG